MNISQDIIQEHTKLMEKGIELHDKFLYQEAILYLEKGYKLLPTCPCCIFNYANTLSMIGKLEEAYSLLNLLIKTPLRILYDGCPENEKKGTRSLFIDSFFLLFRITLLYKGLCKEAFEYARKHIELRTRGIESIWSIQEVRKEIKEMTDEWNELKMNV